MKTKILLPFAAILMAFVTPLGAADDPKPPKDAPQTGKVSKVADGSIKPLPFKVAAKLPDVAQILSPSAVTMDGWLGVRVDANEANRLLKVDTEPLLAGFHKKPGKHPWIGEHIGKWIHSATLAWAYTGDAALRAKLDGVVADLISAQEADGYLGTYVPEKRFGLIANRSLDWDVWAHQGNLIGLLSYYQYTGDEAALTASRKIGDLLLATFPAKRSIIDAGLHNGLAATSVLEPMVLLYRSTGDKRYLDFALYIVHSWDEPKGSSLLKTLLTKKSVYEVPSRKAYEMLINLVGLCELARVTGDREMLQAALNAWKDIVENRLYLTGGTSERELFRADHQFHNGAAAGVAETCATVAWIQLNLELLQLTGEARFGDELERSFYNHLPAAQKPNGEGWCYFTPLEDEKHYGNPETITCCQSSGPRGMALVPQTAYLTSGDTLLVNTFESSSAVVDLGGERVTVKQQSQFPRGDESVLTVNLAKPATFGMKIRVPAWAQPMTVKSATIQSGWAVLPPREWKDGESIAVKFNMAPRVVVGETTNAGRAAWMWGPFVLAYDQEQNPDLPEPGAVGMTESQSPLTLQPGDGALAFRTRLIGHTGTQPKPVTLVPYADAGARGSTFRVWLRGAGVTGESLLTEGKESYSRHPYVENGSINDNDFGSFVTTRSPKASAEDWFAITLNRSAEIRRVIFAHGESVHDGGWFTAKPKVQVQKAKDGPWETIGELSDYPTDGKMSPGQKFELRLKEPVIIVALRVLSMPASGDDPKQAFATCAELQAFGN